MFTSAASASASGNENNPRVCINSSCGATFYVRYNADMGAIHCPHCKYPQG